MESKTNVDFVFYRDVKFNRYPDSERRSDRVYYRPHAGHIRNGVGYLHQEIWKDHYGEIPDGHEIHHKDGDPLNNKIENLECISVKKHRNQHPIPKEVYMDNLKKARQGAKKWHRSKEGRRWHKEHWNNSLKRLVDEKVKLICEQCGVEFESSKIAASRARFCSGRCKSRWRREQGLDDEWRECNYCGNKFKTNKYTKTKTCSMSCAAKMRWEDQKESG